MKSRKKEKRKETTNYSKVTKYCYTQNDRRVFLMLCGSGADVTG